MQHELLKEYKHARGLLAVLLLGMLFGFLLGFLLHDTLVAHNPMNRELKSWYPR